MVVKIISIRFDKTFSSASAFRETQFAKAICITNHAMFFKYSNRGISAKKKPAKATKCNTGQSFHPMKWKIKIKNEKNIFPLKYLDKWHNKISSVLVSVLHFTQYFVIKCYVIPSHLYKWNVAATAKRSRGSDRKLHLQALLAT